MVLLLLLCFGFLFVGERGGDSLCWDWRVGRRGEGCGDSGNCAEEEVEVVMMILCFWVGFICSIGNAVDFTNNFTCRCTLSMKNTVTFDDIN